MSDIVKIDIINGKPSVTSLQVAEAFGKEHFNLLRDIQNTTSKCPESFNAINFELVEYVDGKGEKRPMYALSRDGFMLLAMGYTTPEAMKVKLAYIAEFNRMEEHIRTTLPDVPNFSNPALAARAWADQYERRQIAEVQRDEAVRTKAWISDKKTATAMATASVAVRKVSALEDELGRGKRYKAVKAIPWLLDVFESTKGMYSVVGKALKRMSVDLGYNVEKIPCTEYPDGVNAYHVDVIDALFGELRDNPGMLYDYRLDRAA